MNWALLMWNLLSKKWKLADRFINGLRIDTWSIINSEESVINILRLGVTI
jgi:hypothetical protein